jgi:hypothetical protein
MVWLKQIKRFFRDIKERIVVEINYRKKKKELKKRDPFTY